MKKTFTCFLVCCLFFQNGLTQSDCSSAIVICGNTRSFNPSGIGTKLEQLACGGIEHNSVWLAFQAKANGKLNFVIRPFTPAGIPTATDFDWSLYALPGAPGTVSCDTKTQLSCNFAGTTTAFGIPGATGMASPPYANNAFNPGIDVVNGNWYVLIVDQFANNIPLEFSVQFTDNPESPNLNSTPGIFDNRPEFTINNTSACGGTFSFTNNSVATSGVASYSWDFGDGSTSTAANPTHTYTTPGTYYVTLTATDNNGCASDIRKQLPYNNTPPALATAGTLLLPSCGNSNNGSITIATAGANTLGVSGGTPPYQYELVSPSPTIRPAQTSNVFAGLQPGNYTIKVTDACGKSATNTVTIAQVATNANIAMVTQNIQASCNGTATGSTAIAVSGTVPPYTVALINSSPVLVAPQPTILRDPVTATYYVTFDNLLPGLYTALATDGCGRTRLFPFTITPSTAPIANTIASPSCTGSATGTLTVTATAATGLSGTGSPGAYQYALIAPSPIIRPFQPSSVFENLLPGTYTIATRDACGNIGTVTAVINAAIPATFGTAFTTPSCPNGSTGTIEAQINTAGGGSPYTFELIAPSPVTRAAQTSNLFANLPPGTYTVRLNDACGTPVTGTVTVGAATAPSFTTTLTGSCLTPASGTVTAIPGATSIGPFTFELVSPGAAIRPPQGSNIANSPNSIFTALNQGSYTLRMTDGCNVPVTNTVTIAAPTALAFPAGSASTPSCAASSTGRITVAAPTTGLGAYKYALISPSPVTRAAQYSRIFDNLPVGNYTIRIIDSCGSQVDIGAPLAVAAAAAPTLTVTGTASCATNTGTIQALAANTNQGGGTYEFALIAPSAVTRPNQSSPLFTGLPAGNYTVRITDQCGATGTTTITLAVAGTFAPTAATTITSCNGAGYFGEVYITSPTNFTTAGPIPTGSGGGPYTYSLYNAANTVLIAGPQTNPVFTNVVPVAGSPSHTVRVTDICGNTSTVQVTLNAPAALTNAVISAITASCAATPTGVVRVSTVATGGLAPYTYTLLDGVTLATVAGPQTAITFNNVAANANGYVVRTIDACGNIITSPTVLAFAAAAAPSATVATTASCATPASGRIVVTPGIGATLAGGTFTYSLYNAANTVLITGPQSSPVFNGVAPATYTVRIIDRCGTIGTVAATIASGVTAPTAAGVASGTCTGGSNGVVTGSSAGGSLPITYTLVNQVTNTVVAGPQADNVFAGLAAGTYIVRVIDACGTVTNSANVAVGNVGGTPSLTTSTAIDCSGSAIISGFGGAGNGGPYTYAVCSGSGCTTFGAFGTSSTFTINTNGTYRIATRDRCGAEISSADIVVTIPPKAVVTAVTKANACGTTTITPSFTNVPNTPYYSVDGANFGPTIGSIPPGCHTLRITNFNAGTFGCASDAFSFTVYEAPALTPATPSNWSVTCGNPNVTPGIASGTGTTGCVGSGGSMGVRLVSCIGCNGTSDAAGTVKASGTSFRLAGASNATFEPVIIVGGFAICAGTQVAADFTAPPFNCFLLPVSLVHFSGQRDGAINKLIWTTSSEQNNKGFAIQRSTDGNNFTEIGFINSLAPGGNSTQELSYSFNDNNPGNTTQYYRLRQEDLNGQSKFSAIVTIQVIRPVILTMTGLFPNPANTEVNVLIDAPVKEKITLVVTDIAGKNILQKAVTIEAGSNTVPIQIGALKSGAYLMKLVCTSNCENAVTKFVKL